MLNRYRFDPPSLLLHIFIYLKLNGKYFRYSVIYILGNACGGITFETDKQEWTLRWGNELVVSENLEEKSILRSCYGKNPKISRIFNKRGKKRLFSVLSLQIDVYHYCFRLPERRR